MALQRLRDNCGLSTFYRIFLNFLLGKLVNNNATSVYYNSGV